jgi:hypothetical protein
MESFEYTALHITQHKSHSPFSKRTGSSLFFRIGCEFVPYGTHPNPDFVGTSFMLRTLYAFVPKRIKIIMQRRQDMKPLTGWPKDVFPVLVRLVDFIAKQRAVKEFYTGRGADPSERRSYHGSDDIVAIYFTDSVDNAIVVESALIKTFYDHPKCSNDAPHGGGGVTEEYGSYVYVAIWL